MEGPIGGYAGATPRASRSAERKKQKRKNKLSLASLFKTVENPDPRLDSSQPPATEVGGGFGSRPDFRPAIAAPPFRRNPAAADCQSGVGVFNCRGLSVF